MNKIIEIWSYLLGGTSGPVFGGLFIFTSLLYIIGFAFIADKMNLEPKKWDAWPKFAAVLSLIIGTAAMMLASACIQTGGSAPKITILGLSVAVCVPVIFVPLQMLGMKGSYLKHLIASVLCIAMTGIVMNFAPKLVQTAGMFKQAGNASRAQLDRAREQTQPQVRQRPPQAVPSSPVGTDMVPVAPPSGVARPNTSKYRNIQIPQRTEEGM